MTLEHYCTLFSQLRRAPGPMWGAETRNRAPHKPLLLLAVMDLVARGVLTSRFVSIAGELVELNDLFTDYWRSIVPVTQTSSIAFPFPRLDTEPFWKLVALPGREITRPIINAITTVSQLRNVALGAEIDEALFQHMTNAAGRAALPGSCATHLRTSGAGASPVQRLDRAPARSARPRRPRARRSATMTGQARAPAATARLGDTRG